MFLPLSVRSSDRKKTERESNVSERQDEEKLIVEVGREEKHLTKRTKKVGEPYTSSIEKGLPSESRV